MYRILFFTYYYPTQNCYVECSSCVQGQKFLTCCAKGGAWAGKCGTEGSGSEHSWFDGQEACQKGKDKLTYLNIFYACFHIFLFNTVAMPTNHNCVHETFGVLYFRTFYPPFSLASTDRCENSCQKNIQAWDLKCASKTCSKCPECDGKSSHKHRFDTSRLVCITRCDILQIPGFAPQSLDSYLRTFIQD